MAIARVQGPTSAAEGVGVTSISQSLASQATVGNHVFAAVGVYDTAVIGVTTFSDNRSNTWQTDSESADQKNTNDHCRAARGSAKVETTGSPFTITASWGAAVDPALAIDEYSGIATTSWLDTQNAAIGSSTTAQPGSVTPSSGERLVLSNVMLNFGGRTVTPPGAPWVERHTDGFDNSWIEKIATYSGGSENPSYSLSDTSGWAATIAVYKEASGTAFTLTAAGGTYAASGTAATGRSARKLAANAATYSESGTAATFGIGLPVGSGSYAVVGTAAAILAGRQLAVDSAAFAVSGQASSFDVVMPALSAAYAMTGAEATLTYSGAAAGPTLTAAAGSFAVSGTVAILTADRILAPASAGYSVSGQAATFGISIPAGTTSYSIGGTAAALRVDRSVSAAAGSYAVNGTTVSLQVDRTLAALGASYAVNGAVAGLAYGYRLAAAGDAYAWSGQSVALAADRVLSAAIGSYVWTASDATLTITGLPHKLADSGRLALLSALSRWPAIVDDERFPRLQALPRHRRV